MVVRKILGETGGDENVGVVECVEHVGGDGSWDDGDCHASNLPSLTILQKDS